MRVRIVMIVATLSLAAAIAIAGLSVRASDSDTLVGKWESEIEVEGGWITLWFNSDGTGRYLWEQTGGGGSEDVAFEWIITTGMFYDKPDGEINYQAHDYALDGEDRLYIDTYGWLTRAGSDDSLLSGLGCCSCCGSVIAIPVVALLGAAVVTIRRRK